MSVDYRKYGPRLVDLVREFLRTKDVEVWMNAYCALCAEAVPERIDDIGGAAESFATAAMNLLTSEERVRFAQLLLGTPNLVNRLHTKMQEIKAQKAVAS